MNSIPDIYVATVLSNFLSLSIIGGLLLYRTPREERLFLCVLVVVMLPMNVLAYHLLRMPFDSWLSVTIGKDSWLYGFIRNFYAPFTEEPAKLWPLLIPFVYRRITKENVVRVALAIGLGFGVGEAWNVANLLLQSPGVAKYPWYMLSGFIFERSLVCIGHAAFVGVTMYFIVIRREIIKGVCLGMLLHFIGNFPIYLARNNVLGFGKDVWQALVALWVILYFLTMGAILAYMVYGNKWLEKFFRGTIKCPECGNTYRRPFFKVQLLHKCYEKCPLCKHWHLVNALSDD
jgi:hypothetical protein